MLAFRSFLQEGFLRVCDLYYCNHVSVRNVQRHTCTGSESRTGPQISGLKQVSDGIVWLGAAVEHNSRRDEIPRAGSGVTSTAHCTCELLKKKKMRQPPGAEYVVFCQWVLQG